MMNGRSEWSGLTFFAALAVLVLLNLSNATIAATEEKVDLLLEQSAAATEEVRSLDEPGIPDGYTAQLKLHAGFLCQDVGEDGFECISMVGAPDHLVCSPTEPPPDNWFVCRWQAHEDDN